MNHPQLRYPELICSGGCSGELARLSSPDECAGDTDLKFTTVSEIKNLPPGTHNDRRTERLYVRVYPPNQRGRVARTWVLRYMREGVVEWLRLGECDLSAEPIWTTPGKEPEEPRDTLCLADARQKAALYSGWINAGQRPGTVLKRREQTDKLAKANTCYSVLLAVIEKRNPSPKKRDELNQLIETHLKHLHDLPIRDLRTEDVANALQPAWDKIPKTAERARALLAQACDYANGRGMRTGDNPASKAIIQHFAPDKPAIEHHAALPWRDAPRIMQALRQDEMIYARMVELILLTASRQGMIVEGAWDEILLDDALWTVPAARMKADKDHIIPLPRQAVAILRILPRTGSLLFPMDSAARRTHPATRLVHPVTLKRHLVRAGAPPDVTVHGLRSTFRDWAGDETDVDRETIEHCLAHIVGGTEGAYRRGSAVQKRHLLMQRWADYLDTKAAEKSL